MGEQIARLGAALRRAPLASKPQSWRELFELVLDQLVDDPDVALSTKLLLLQDARSRIVAVTSEVVPQAPAQAPQLWLDRPARVKDPVSWARSVYGQWLGAGLTQADIRKLDRPLYTALQNWKSRYGWPSDFVLPSRKELNDEFIKRLSAEEIRENKRITEALRHRIRSSE